MRSRDMLQALELLLMRYRTFLPYDAWLQVCMHFMYLLEGLLPPDDAYSVHHRDNAEHSHTEALHVPSEEVVEGHISRSESLDDDVTDHDYTRSQRLAWTAKNAVVLAKAPNERPEEMAWDLLPAAIQAMHQVMHCVLHRMLHQPPPSVRCMHPA